MTDIFEESEEEAIEALEEFEKVEVEDDLVDAANMGLDARRRLENMLDEKRLRDELDDFGDY